MKSKNIFLIMGSLLIATNAMAQTQRSEAEQKAAEEKTTIGVTNLALRPTVGAIFFDGNQRFTGGILADFNVLSTPNVKLGPAIGALYSSVSGTDFFSGISTDNKSYIMQFPANIKATATPDPEKRLQLGVHGGANIVRSTGATGLFGSDTGGVVTGSSWDIHPNVGGDIDFALGTNADITLRPDVTFLPAFNIVTTTLGLALKL